MNKALTRLSTITNRELLRIIIPFGVVVFFLVYRTFLTPDVLFFILFMIFLSYGMALEFIKMFSPFVFLLLSYDALRSFVPFITHRVHYVEMIDFDRFIGHGTVPTLRLQHLLYHGHLMWYDFYFYALYMMHFVVPVLIGVLIWRTRPQAYWQYVWTLVTLSYAAFVTFLAFPAAPPWLAAQHHLIPMFEKLSTDIWWAMGVQGFPTLYAKLSPNEVAAVPSLHSAYPLVVALFVNKLYGWRWGLAAAIYPISMWIGVVYMGEHYVFDVLVGILYVCIAYLAVPRIMKAWRIWRKHPIVPPAPNPETVKA